jgi:hypothetical protein
MTQGVTRGTPLALPWAFLDRPDGALEVISGLSPLQKCPNPSALFLSWTAFLWALAKSKTSWNMLPSHIHAVTGWLTYCLRYA